jgi:ABC-type sugar transport system ATPase subunit
MNFFQTDLEDGIFTLNGRRYDTGARLSQRVIIGIRPEALQIGPGVKGRVRWVETLGAHFLAGVTVEDKLVTVLLRTKPAGETIDLSVDVDQMHVFDTTSGKNLRFAAA